jgi:cytosine/uracil/thiamine/allantoin permease
MRDNLLKEKHNGGLGGHFGHDKTYEKLSYLYYWLGMGSNVNNFVDIWIIFQYDKEKQ